MNPHMVKIVHFLPGRVRFRIEGLRGNSYFAGSIEKTLERYDVIHKVIANPSSGKALILFDPGRLSLDGLYSELLNSLELILSRGMPDAVIKSVKKKEERTRRKENDVFEPEDIPVQSQKRKVIGSGAILAGLTAKRLFLGRSARAVSPGIVTIAALTTIVTGYPILRSGLDSLFKKRKLNNDLLISAATIVSLLLRESITGLVVVWLVNLSTLFQSMTLEKSRKAIKEMLQGKDEMAWLEVNGAEVSVPIDSLKVEDTVVVHIGEKVPVDGVVSWGEAAVSQAIITGEAIPIAKAQGDKVYAGSIVEQGSLRITAEKVGSDTSVARIIQMVDQASKVRAPIENLAERYAEKIVPLSFGLALLNYLITRDFRRSMTMLIVACPCAAGLATPTAISASMGNAAKRGILVKGGNYLEKVGKTNVVLFDKTGTLTEGNPSLVAMEILHKNYSLEKILQLAASVESHTNHPLAKAILHKAEELKIEIIPAAQQQVVIGYGVKGTVNNGVVMVGNRQFLEDNGININRGEALAEKLKLMGQTVLYIAHGKALIGIMGIKDRVRAESKRAIEQLREDGIEDIGLITGDSAEAGELVKNELGLDHMWANTLPEGKVAIVENYQNEGKLVTMVGEGINDSPALATADIGIAMGTGGTDVAIESADVVLAADDPEKIVTLVRLSNHTMEIIKQNFIFAVGVNALGLVLGAGNIISPLTAALVHNLSTLGVVVNSSRLMNYSPDGKKGKKNNGRAKGIGK